MYQVGILNNIRNNNYNTIPNRTASPRSQVVFGKNVVHLWLDSDGTHFPDDDQTILNPGRSGEKRFQDIKKAFNNLSSFIRKCSDTVKLNITTGRNRGEYKHFLKLLGGAGLDYVSPERLTIKNGGDVYVNTKSLPLKDFIGKGMSSDSIDTAKAEEIKKVANWDADYVRSSILKSMEDYDFPILMSPNGNSDYGDKSANNILRDRGSWTAFLRQDGDLNFFIGLPLSESGKNNAPALAEKIKTKLDKKEISYDLTLRDKDGENSDGPAIVITPKINGHKLGKDYDVARALKAAIKEGDLVIAAGNGSNDEVMLNPDSYKDISENENDLPLMSVVIPDKQCLRDLVQKHPDKVIAVEDAYHLQDGIKLAIKKYAESHPDFELKPEMKNSL